MSLDLRHDGPTLVGRVPILTGMRNVRGMPQVAFIEEISAFVQDHNVPLDEILQALSTIHRCARRGGRMQAQCLCLLLGCARRWSAGCCESGRYKLAAAQQPSRDELLC